MVKISLILNAQNHVAVAKMCGVKRSVYSSLLVWIGIHVPAFVMITTLFVDRNQHATVLIHAGYWAVACLVITLSLNPLIVIFKSTWLRTINQYRRHLGVASFSYTFIHALCFFIKRIDLDLWQGGWQYFFHPAIAPAFLLAFPILLVLAITSNHFSIKFLSPIRWKKLHKCVYIAEIAIIVHMVLTGYGMQALLLFVPLIILQLIRQKMQIGSG